MTEPHDLDELASAHLDGATTADEAARIAADPALQARVEALRAVRSALRAPAAEPPEDAREAAIAAALAAYDDDDGQAAGGPDRSVVTPLPPRRGLSPTAIRVVGAAAVVALLALAVPLLLRSADDDDTATSFEATGEAISDGALERAEDGGEQEAAGGGDQSTTTGGVPLEADLGSYSSVDELLAHIGGRTSFEQGSTPDSGGFSAPESAEDRTSCAAARQAASEVARAVVDSREVLVLLLRRDDGSQRLTVVDAVTCEVLADRG
jgi:hypothetical protein